MKNAEADAVLLNGEPSRDVSVFDRGLHFGDGLFETLSCRAGKPRFLRLHLERLAEGCARLGLKGCDLATVRAEVLQLASQADASIVKIIVTRGDARVRGYGIDGSEQVTRLALRYPWPAQTPAEGFRVGLGAMRLGENPALAGLKHLNRLEQVLAQREKDARQLDELLLSSSSGRLISGIASNVFLVRAGVLHTPRLDVCGVAGIMRRVLLKEARKAGIASEEAALRVEDLDAADEVFVSSSRLGLVPVVSIESRERAVGPVTRRLEALIAPMLENPVDG